MEFDDGDPEPEVEGIPLADEETKKPAKPKSGAKIAAAAAAPTVDLAKTSPSAGEPKEDDAIAQFLLDLKLDDEE
jgi:hypothetical protein